MTHSTVSELDTCGDQKSGTSRVYTECESECGTVPYGASENCKWGIRCTVYVKGWTAIMCGALVGFSKYNFNVT